MINFAVKKKKIRKVRQGIFYPDTFLLRPIFSMSLFPSFLPHNTFPIPYFIFKRRRRRRGKRKKRNRGKKRREKKKEEEEKGKEEEE